MKTTPLNTMASSRCCSFVLLAICSFLSPLTQSLEAAEPKRSFIAADSSKQRIAIIGEDGKTTWETKIGPLHDLHVLPNGNVLFQKTWTEIAEVNPKSGETVWSYDAKAIPSNKSVPMEIHAFQRLADGNTMVAESGPGRIIELDAKLKVASTMALKVSRPDPHRDTRLVRKLSPRRAPSSAWRPQLNDPKTKKPRSYEERGAYSLWDSRNRKLSYKVSKSNRKPVSLNRLKFHYTSPIVQDQRESLRNDTKAFHVI